MPGTCLEVALQLQPNESQLTAGGQSRERRSRKKAKLCTG